ncbi:energy-coupling factor transporter transmembrane protein EcfT [Methanoplanus sp. FWC-SCC4]|uniref:Energy-coupling factor transporter transmembrane protein EcfT n=1 Tax=Methanochimaera problematica TaxID=2609417 RepID=A0AA97FC37_9EURY|nr:energy-coupling factor transporter transmembrane component T [Methanoplanus sp. FWC-SCC4]WOF15484.1 energy-coupling factor transporter transmembrane protein EcfT [Methanoplanus sp. FWC-SCC4]
MAEILQYKRIDGIFHRMNALTKIILLGFIIVLAVISTNPLFLGGVVVFLFCLSVAGRFARELLAQIPMIMFLSAGLLLLTILTMQSGDVIGYLIPTGIPVIGGHIPITEGALNFALILSLRFFVMLFAFQVLIVSTQPRALVNALQKLRLPVDYTLMLLIAIRFIPSLQLEGKRIQEAQLARAYNPGTGVLGKVRSLTPIMIPLVSNALGKANVLGLTIDLRGLRTMKRTPDLNDKFIYADYAAFIFVGLCVAALVYSLLSGSPV